MKKSAIEFNRGPERSSGAKVPARPNRGSAGRVALLVSLLMLLLLSQGKFLSARAEDGPSTVPFGTLHASVKQDGVMSGVTYATGIDFGMGYTGYSDGTTGLVTYNLKGRYSGMSFTVGHLDGTNNRDAKMTITADGRNLYEDEVIGYADAPKRYSVPLSGVSQLIIRMDSNGYDHAHYLMTNIAFTAVSEDWDALRVSDEFFDIPKVSAQNCSVVSGDFSMGGYDYQNGYLMNMGYTGYASGTTSKLCYNFNGQYRKLSFDIARDQSRGTAKRAGYLTITKDGSTLDGYDQLELQWNDLVKHVEIDLTGASEVVIQMTSNGYDHTYWCLGDIQLVSDGHAHGILLSKSSVTLTSSAPSAEITAKVYPSDAADRTFWVNEDNELINFCEWNANKDGVRVYGRFSGTEKLTFITNEPGHTHSAACDVTTKLAKAKFLPSVNGWGFKNFNPETDGYYDGVHKRICFFAYQDAFEKELEVDSFAKYAYYFLSNDTIANLGLISTSQEFLDKLYLRGGSELLKQMSKKEKGGVCNGLSMTAALTYTGDLPFSKWEWSGSPASPAEITTLDKYDGYSSDYELYFKQLAYAVELVDLIPGAAFRQTLSTNRYDDLMKLVSAFQSTGKTPVVLKLTKNDKAHAVLPYEVLKVNDGALVYIYDSNAPGDDNRYIRLTMDDDGNVTDWHYSDYNMSDTKLQYLEYSAYKKYASRLNTASFITDKCRMVTTTVKNFLMGSSASSVSAGKALLSCDDGQYSGNTSQTAVRPLRQVNFDGELVSHDPMLYLADSADFCMDMNSTGRAEMQLLGTDYGFSVGCDGGATIEATDDQQTFAVTSVPDDRIEVRYNTPTGSICATGIVPNGLKVTIDHANRAFDVQGFSEIQITTIKNGTETRTKYQPVSPDETQRLYLDMDGDEAGEIAETLAAYAFENCGGFARIEVPKGIKAIADYAFKNCSNLTVVVPDTVISIGEDAFADCTDITLEVAEYSYAWSYCIDHGIPIELLD